MLVTQLRSRSVYLGVVCLFVAAFTFLSSKHLRNEFIEHVSLPKELIEAPQHPIYKPPRNVPPPIEDNFPLAVTAKSPRDLPPIPSFNQPPEPHIPENTPLFIGFTRNWLLLQQTVVSYITAGWPASDIYVVENTGTMNSNKLGRLSLQNPFYLDYDRLTEIFGVNVISTPTYLSFAQLQNFYLNHAIEKDWQYYFWGHMDVAALSDEDYTDPDTGNYSTLYMRTVQDLRHTLSPKYAMDEQGRTGRWAIKFYAYDRLALVNRHAYEEVGGWDVQIPYYGTDCDMHERLTMAGLKQEDSRTGLVYDLGSSLTDLFVLYRRKPRQEPATVEEGRSNSSSDKRDELRWGEEDNRASSTYHDLIKELDRMQTAKNSDERGRNTWQATQSGGEGEPYYRDPEGFEKAVEMTIEFGREVMAEKWGHRGCDLRGSGLGPGDEWRVEKDW